MTDDEYTALGVMTEGGSLAAIGKWEKILDALISKGWAICHDKFNHSVTVAGRAAYTEREDADIRAVIEANNRVAEARRVEREAVAGLIADETGPH